MKTTRIVAMVLLLAGSMAGEAPAQLAITEVMAASSTNLLPAFEGPDYWELTNFGTNDINLHGYGFHDDDAANFYTYPFDNLVITGRTSVVFVRTNQNFYTVAAFKAWWGEANLPQDLQIRFYARPGLNGDTGDEVWVFDSDNEPVSHVSFGKSIPGRSFTYSSDSGEFGVDSKPGMGGAFRALTATNDIGSPGWTTGPVPLAIEIQPASQVVNGCDGARFSVYVTGLPQPKYQWTSNGIAIPGATAPALILPEIDSSSTAAYQVILNNGFMTLTSALATLTVSTLAAPPRIVAPLADVSAFSLQTATFSLEARGFPCLQYQWRSNGVALAGATDRLLSVAIAADAPDSSIDYCVTAWNELGSTNACATLKVVRRPRLLITEIMSSPADGAVLGHENWFELTNGDTNTVDLRNYRFRDSSSISVASRITNSLFIRPGESIVFVEAMSPEQFKQWWGVSRLPPDLQIVTWGGWGLSVGGTDYIYVWNPGATDPYDTVANETRAAATAGFSQLSLGDHNYCDGTAGCSGRFLDNSVEGERGAFRAAEGGDIGSPGYAAFPRVLGISRTNSNVSVRCLVEPGKTYRVLAKDTLSEGGWTTVSTMPAENNWVITISDPRAQTVPSRFYRIEELP